MNTKNFGMMTSQGNATMDVENGKCDDTSNWGRAVNTEGRNRKGRWARNLGTEEMYQDQA